MATLYLCVEVGDLEEDASQEDIRQQVEQSLRQELPFVTIDVEIAEYQG